MPTKSSPQPLMSFTANCADAAQRTYPTDGILLEHDEAANTWTITETVRGITRVRVSQMAAAEARS